MSSNVGGPRGGGADDVAGAARALEAYFMRTMLAELHGSGGSSLAGGGFAGATFQEMLDGALADAASQGKGVGLAGTLASSLRGFPHGAAKTGVAVPEMKLKQLKSQGTELGRDLVRGTLEPPSRTTGSGRSH